MNKHIIPKSSNYFRRHVASRPTLLNGQLRILASSDIRSQLSGIHQLYRRLSAVDDAIFFSICTVRPAFNTIEGFIFDAVDAQNCTYILFL